jgi:hypothetical protein
VTFKPGKVLWVRDRPTGLVDRQWSCIGPRSIDPRASGGASYDGPNAATAVHHGASLLTRDERAAEIYERVGADVTWVAT